MKKFSKTVPAYVQVEQGKDGVYIVSIFHHKHRGQWMKIRIEGGGNLTQRAIEAVYLNNEGGADAYFKAWGMSDEEAIGNPETWRVS